MEDGESGWKETNFLGVMSTILEAFLIQAKAKKTAAAEAQCKIIRVT